MLLVVPMMSPTFPEIPVPERLTVISSTASSASLSWLVSPEMEQTPHSFLVSYQSEGTEPKSISTGSCSTVITGLKPGTEYTVRVYTELQHGGKSQPASLIIKTGLNFICSEYIMTNCRSARNGTGTGFTGMPWS